MCFEWLKPTNSIEKCCKMVYNNISKEILTCDNWILSSFVFQFKV